MPIYVRHYFFSLSNFGMIAGGKWKIKVQGEKNIFKREGENGIKNGCTCLKMASFRIIYFYLFRLCIFFVIFIVICLYVFMSIFLAVVYNNYRSNLKNEVHEAIRQVMTLFIPVERVIKMTLKNDFCLSVRVHVHLPCRCLQQLQVQLEERGP